MCSSDLDKVIGDEFGLIPPITFYGKTHTKQNVYPVKITPVVFVGFEDLILRQSEFRIDIDYDDDYVKRRNRG